MKKTEEEKYDIWLRGKEFWTSQRLMILAIVIAMISVLFSLVAPVVNILVRNGWVTLS